MSSHRRDFERDIKRDIRNNPIIREVDQARQRELWRSVGIGVFLVAVLLFSAWQHFELLQHGYRIEQVQQERALRTILQMISQRILLSLILKIKM